MRRQFLLLVAGLASACGQTQSEPPASTGELGAGIVARAGNEDIRGETVALIAQQQSVSPKQALELALKDALFAHALRQRDDAVPVIAVAERAALARTLLEQLRAQANQAGPPTPAEVQTVMTRHWYSVDRPAGARTIHAVALSKEPPDRPRARALAEKLAKAVAAAKSPEQFEKAAQQVPGAGIEIKVEQLPSVALDGRVIPGKPPVPGDPIGELERPYAEAANALANPGDQSGIVETKFGYHVIMLVERTPAVSMPETERAKVVSREVLANRARALETALLESVRGKLEVQYDRAARELTARVPVTP